MAILDIQTFPGEAPAVSEHNLGGDAARVNRNLSLVSGEFRPLADDVVHSSCPVATRTLYRLARDGSGAFVDDPAAPLLAWPDARSLVKGQINDEASERTFMTMDDGSAAPRVIDAQGTDRLLGVPRPLAPVIAVTKHPALAQEAANAWFDQTLPEQVKNAIVAAVTTATQGSTLYIEMILHNKVSNDVVSCKIGRVSGTSVTVTRGSGSNDDTVNRVVTVVGENITPATWKTRVAQAKGTTASNLVLRYGTHYTLAPVYSKIYTVGKAAVQTALAAIQYPATWGEMANTPVFGAGDAARIANTAQRWLDAPGNVNDDLEMAMLGLPVADMTQDAKAAASTMSAAFAALAGQRAAQTGVAQAALDDSYSQISTSAHLVRDWVADTLGQKGQDAVLTAVGEGAEPSARFYVVAFVTDRGEESEPSPVTDMVEVAPNDTVTVTRPAAASGEALADRHIETWRIYRSNSSANGGAWQLVDEQPVAMMSYVDAKKNDELRGLQPQFEWQAPPYRMDGGASGVHKPAKGANPYLRGLVGMPNGIMAGFIDNTVAFCEPYVPYAWPVAYQVTTEYPIVGLGVFGQSLFVGTTGTPVVVSGAHSAHMSANKLNSNQACLAARSIVSVAAGCLYASPDGLCLVNHEGVRLLTRQTIARAQWQAMQPATMFAAEHEEVVYLFYAGEYDGEMGGCLAVSLADGLKIGRVGFAQLPTAVWSDKYHDRMYAAIGNQVVDCFAGANRREGYYRSGTLRLPRQMPLAWAKVYGEQSPALPLVLHWHGDGKLRHTVTFTDKRPQRLPAGRFLEHRMTLVGHARATRVMLASTSEELRAV